MTPVFAPHAAPAELSPVVPALPEGYLQHVPIRDEGQHPRVFLMLA